MLNKRTAYIICSNPRSGTTLLCDMLKQTGVAGRPNSFFREKSLKDWCEEWGVAGPIDRLDDGFSNRFFAAIERERRGDNGVLGIRIMGPDRQLSCEWLARRHSALGTDAARFDAAFGPTRYIHLSRQDKLAEAVSYLRAEQTGLWHGKPDGSDLEKIAPTEPDGYDAEKISARMAELTQYDREWLGWFEQENLQPLRMTYEALAENPLDCLREVLNFIEQDPNAAEGVSPGVRKLADETSAAWIEQFRSSNSAR